MGREADAMKVLVTGASGYLGGGVARALAARGDEVHVFQRSPSPVLAGLGMTLHVGDLRDAAAVRTSVAGVEVVFHGAAKVGAWGREEEFTAVNVQGTENVLAACRAEGVPRLVYTSSASVVFGGNDQEGVDESVPYPAEPLSPYTRTKAEAERRVLDAAGDALATVALRPHLVWGPGDPHLVGRILLRVRQGHMGVIGDGQNRIDTTCIENAVAAHLLADQCLAHGGACAGNGKAYFITNGEPLPIRELLDGILAAAGLPPISRSIPSRLAHALAAFSEWVYRTFPIEGEPELTRFVVREFAASHWFDIRAARRDLGYEPAVTTEEGLRRLHASFFPE
jgi:nucleoside-diphosphate-sugar epimerase